MSDQDFFVLDEDGLLKISDLIECLGLAIEKIVASNRLIKGRNFDHPAINGFRRMAEESVELVSKEADLTDIF